MKLGQPLDSKGLRDGSNRRNPPWPRRVVNHTTRNFDHAFCDLLTLSLVRPREAGCIAPEASWLTLRRLA
jgi:hypothetical protein